MAEQAELSEAAIAALKQKHGDRLSAVKAPDGTTWVVQRPPKEVWALYMADLTKDRDSASVAHDRLALDCVVHPDRASVASVLREYAAFGSSLSNVLGEMAGLSTDLSAKKL